MTAQPKPSAKEKAKKRAPAKKRTSRSSQQKHDVKKLYELGTAFWASGTLLAAIKLGLFTKLDSGPLSSDAVARRLGTDRRWTDKLLIACASLGLLERVNGSYSNSATTKQFLVEGKPYYQGEFFTHMSNLWQRFGTLEHTVKTGNRADQQSGENNDATSNRAWIMSSHNIAMGGQAEALARALDLRGRKHLCDVGGGPGTYAAVLCLRNAGLRATVIDDPEIISVAKELIARFDLGDRVTAKPAQLLSASYGDGYDVVLLSGVLHGMTEANCKRMLRKAYNALESGGIVVIQEMLLDDDEPKPVLPALFSLNMTLGASYSAAEIMSWLYSTGFVKAEVKDIPDAYWLDHVIIAKKV